MRFVALETLATATLSRTWQQLSAVIPAGVRPVSGLQLRAYGTSGSVWIHDVSVKALAVRPAAAVAQWESA